MRKAVWETVRTRPSGVEGEQSFGVFGHGYRLAPGDAGWRHGPGSGGPRGAFEKHEVEGRSA
jgi:hypothetical protein